MAAVWFERSVEQTDDGVKFESELVYIDEAAPDAEVKAALHTPAAGVDVWAPEYHADGTADAWVRPSNDYALTTMKNPLTENRWTNVAPVVNARSTWNNVAWIHKWTPPAPKSWYARAWRRVRIWTADRLHALAYWVDPW